MEKSKRTLWPTQYNISLINMTFDLKLFFSVGNQDLTSQGGSTAERTGHSSEELGRDEEEEGGGGGRGR